MDKRYFIELTNRLYRLTLLFPQKEALRHKIRMIADEVLIELVVILEGEPKEKRESAFNVERNIEILDALFELAKKQDWVLKREISDIQDEYLVIKKEVEDFNDLTRKELREVNVLPVVTEEKEKKEEKITASFVKKEDLNNRQEKILGLVKEKERIQVKDIQEILPKITKRTLRRDLNFLMDRSLVRRIGKGNGTYYMSAEHNRTKIGQR